MPLTVLVVDDDAQKARQVADGIAEVSGSKVEIVLDANSAKRALRETTFDLVVLDIALPLRLGEEPVAKGGLELLEEVLSRSIYRRPRHIVGLTAYRDVYENAAVEFGNELWS